MPNWCNNNITIEGPKEKIKAIWDKVQADPDKGFFQHLVPAPKELDGTTSPTPQPGWAGYKGPQPVVDGVDNWYDWRSMHWGTKWNLDPESINLDDSDPEHIIIEFLTAWGPPEGILSRLNEVFKFNKGEDALSIQWFYREDGIGFCGYLDQDLGINGGF